MRLPGSTVERYEPTAGAKIEDAARVLDYSPVLEATGRAIVLEKRTTELRPRGGGSAK
jgi:hypothetical protein